MCGLAVSCDSNAATFMLNIDVYCSMLKDSKSSTKPVAPFLCIIPDSPKYKSGNKPMPYNNHFVSLTGYLTNVHHKNNDPSQAVERFVITVQDIVFLGTSSDSANTVLPNTLDSSFSPPFFSKF